MNVLGISGVFGHDSAACLIAGGRVVAMAEEERFLRRRHAFNELPVKAALFCLAKGGIDVSDIDVLAVSWNPNLDPFGKFLENYLTAFLATDLFRSVRPNVEYVDHHIAHAASAVFSSGWQDAAILVVDGQGENSATSIGKIVQNLPTLDQVFGIKDSLGHMYRLAAQHAGFRGASEGKFMGLAAYGRPSLQFPITLDENGYRIDLLDSAERAPLEVRRELARTWTNWLTDRIGPPMPQDPYWDFSVGRVKDRSERPRWTADLAASAQNTLESVVVHLAEIAVRKAGTRRLLLAGGVALNCAANGRILKSDLIDEIYIPPAANDAGTALGAAQWIAAQAGSQEPLQSAGLGPAFRSEDVAEVLKLAGVPFRSFSDPTSEAATHLAAGRTVAWFQGGMEIGPRALGHRSMLAVPNHVSINTRMNTIKGRELWRPLAPSILAEFAPELVPGIVDSPYMLMAGEVSARGRTLMPAVVHEDGTTRPQTVRAGNHRFRRLIENVYQETGVPALMNTSFNVAGEPIVCTPHDALSTFFRTGLDVLVIEDIVVTKTSN